MKRSVFIVVIELILLSFASANAPAAETPSTGTLTVMFENDLFSSHDGHYTNGIGFVWVPDRGTPTPGWAERLATLLPWFPSGGELRHGYAFGQNMYTPDSIDQSDPPSTERPYAGWLYGNFGVGRVSDRQLDLLIATVGVVGPDSGAEQTQKAVHRIFGANQPQGWSTQLHNELGVGLTYERMWRGEEHRSPISGRAFDISPYAGGTVGNVYTYADTGVLLRYGNRLPKDFGPPRIQPALLGSGEFFPSESFNWYLFAGVEGRYVARNIFLDGNTFRDSRSVDKKNWVGDAQFGIVLDWQTFRVTYTHVRRTREFTTQGHEDSFGALTFSTRL